MLCTRACLFSIGLLLVVSDWGAVVEKSVGNNNISFERHLFINDRHGWVLVLGIGKY